MFFGHGRNTGSALAYPQGANLIRLHDSGTNWGQLQPERGKFNWAPLESRLAEAEKHNMKVLYTFSNTPAWAALPQMGAPKGLASPTGNRPANLQDWSNYVASIVKESMGRIAYWELWNEANYNGFWCGSIGQLLAMVQSAYDIIKSEYPDAVVLSPSVTYSWSGNSVLTALPQYLDASFWRYADAIAVHGYLPDSAPALNIGPTFDGVHSLLTKYGLDMPVWDTESGFKDNKLVPDSQKRQWVIDWIDVRQQSGLAAACWYQWDNQTHGTLSDLSGNLTIAGQAWMDTYKSLH